MWLASFRPAEVIALDHPLNPVRHELRLHGLCERSRSIRSPKTEVADYVAQRSPSLAGNEGSCVRCTSARRSAALRGLGHERGPSACRQRRRPRPTREPGGSGESDGHHRSLHCQARQRAAHGALGGGRVRRRIPCRAPSRTHSSATSRGSVDLRGARARATVAIAPTAQEGSDRRAAILVPACAVPPGVVRAHGTLARAQLHRKVGAALERERAAGVAVAPRSSTRTLQAARVAYNLSRQKTL